MKKLIFPTLLLSLCSHLAALEQGFESLRQLDDTHAQSIKLTQANWQFDKPLQCPYGWYFVTGATPGEFRVVRGSSEIFSGQQAIYLKGDLLQDSTLVPVKPGKQYMTISVMARSPIPNATITLGGNFISEGGSTVGNVFKSIKITSKWEKYSINIPIPAEYRTRPILRVAPQMGSKEGAFFDDFSAACIDGVPPDMQRQAIAGAVKPPQRALKMNFDFSKAQGKKELADQSGNFTCFSDSGSFQVEENGLRVAFGARFRIPVKNQDFSDRFTITAWVAKASQQREFLTPLLSRGLVWSNDQATYPGRQDFDFSFAIRGWLPEFRTHSGGLRVNGTAYANVFLYPAEWKVGSDPEPVKMDRYTHYAAVYDQGNISLYVDGQLQARRKMDKQPPLLISNLPFYIGAERSPGESDNAHSAEMLINDLKIFNTSLSEAEVAGDYNDGCDKYPENSISLKDTRAYFAPDMQDLDSEMTTRLPITQEYAANLPADPYVNLNKLPGEHRKNNGQVQLYINNEPQSMIFANPYYDTKPWRIEEFVRNFAAADVTINRVALYDFWNAPGKYDFNEIDRRLTYILQANPKAKILFNIAATPPSWFKEQYPDELEEFYIEANNPAAGTMKWKGYGGPMGSDLWLEMSEQMLRDVVKRMEESKFANHIFGYGVSGGDSGEWYWPGQFALGPTGYSIPTRNNFRKFLQKRYNNDVTALQKAWNMPQITFDTVEVPSPQVRNSSENGVFRDQTKVRNVFDLRDFLNERTFLNFERSCRAIRETAGKERIVLTYYGYPLYWGARYGVLLYSGLQTSREALMSPWIDGIATPIDYQRRRGGEPGVNIAGFTGSAQLHGKMLYREEDLRTHLYQRLECGRTANLSESIEVIKRAFGYAMAENYTMWFVCQAGHAAFHQKDMMAEVKKLKRAADESITQNRSDVSEIALVFDEKASMTALGRTPDFFIRQHIWGVYENAHQMGAPFKLYFIEDLADPAMPDYKLYIFLNAYQVSPEQQNVIERKVKRNNAVAVWSYAPGYVTPDGFSVDAMKKLTGFQFKEKRQQMAVEPKLLNKNHPITRMAPQLASFKCNPAFGIDDPQAQILAAGNGLNTLAVKEMPGYRSIYSLSPLTRELLTGIADYAGVHVYNRTSDTVLVNHSYLMLHSDKAGVKQLTLPSPRKVTDAVTGKVIAESADHFSVDLPAGATMIFRLE